MSADQIDQAPVADLPVRVDRRRPGRAESVNPKLLPLLRADERIRLAPLIEETLASPPARAERRLDSGQALVLAVGTGGLLWALLATGLAAIL